MRTLTVVILSTFAAACSSGTSPGDGGGGTSGQSGAAGAAGSGQTGNAGRSGGAAGQTGSAGQAGGAGQTGTAGQSGAAGQAGAAGQSGGAAGQSGGAAGQTGTGGTNPLSQDVINAFVAAHNAARSGPLNPTPNPALPPVSWDPILANSAYNYTALCQGASGLLSHNANRSTDYQALGGSGYVGENIYATTANTVAPADAVNDWMTEAPQFSYAADDIGDGGHYAQVVWRASIRIGCDIVNCPNLTYHDSVLCDYSPGGNITGQEPY
ncbi:MAG TPA: CAP domain-containing protein [Polyangia bacterium]|nr:CAP domain-containing protein [Polyangia bacterium]